jgi:hypothetical protein
VTVIWLVTASLLKTTFLGADVGQGLGDRARGETGALHRTGQLLQGHVAAHAGIVHGRGQALGRQDLLVALEVEGAGAAEHLGDGLLQLDVADAEVGAGHLGADGALGDQLIEQVLLEFRGVEHLLVELLAHALAVAVELVAQRVVELLLAHRLAGDLGDRGGVLAEAFVALETD